MGGRGPRPEAPRGPQSLLTVPETGRPSGEGGCRAAARLSGEVVGGRCPLSCSSLRPRPGPEKSTPGLAVFCGVVGFPCCQQHGAFYYSLFFIHFFLSNTLGLPVCSFLLVLSNASPASAHQLHRFLLFPVVCLIGFFA